MTKQNTKAPGNPLPMRIIRKMFPLLEKSFPKAAHKLGYKLFFTPMKFKPPSRELPIVDQAQKFREDVAGKSTQFYTWGDQTKPLVLLVHGWMGRAGQFYKIVEALVERQYFVVSFDGPAHGASAGSKTSVLEFVAAIQKIEERYKKIHFAVGHSFGGITILYSVKQGVNINNIAFIATPTISDDIVNQFEQRINASPAMGEYFREKILKKYGVSFKSISASEVINEVEINSLYLIHDEEDREVGISHARTMEERFPKARTNYTSGLGHTRILRNTDVVNDLVNRIDQFRN